MPYFKQVNTKIHVGLDLAAIDRFSNIGTEIRKYVERTSGGGTPYAFNLGNTCPRIRSRLRRKASRISVTQD